MTAQTLLTIVIALVVIAFVTIKQTRWTPVRVGKLLRMPVIFAVVGVVSLSGAGKQLPAGWQFGLMDGAILAAELVLGVAAGLLMGRWTELRTIDGITRSRLAGAGVAVWLGFIALRIGLAILGHVEHAAVAELQGTVFLVIAVVKVVQAVIIRERVDQHRSSAVERSYAAALR